MNECFFPDTNQVEEQPKPTFNTFTFNDLRVLAGLGGARAAETPERAGRIRGFWVGGGSEPVSRRPGIFHLKQLKGGNRKLNVKRLDNENH